MQVSVKTGLTVTSMAPDEGMLAVLRGRLGIAALPSSSPMAQAGMSRFKSHGSQWSAFVYQPTATWRGINSSSGAAFLSLQSQSVRGQRVICTAAAIKKKGKKILYKHEHIPIRTGGWERKETSINKEASLLVNKKSFWVHSARWSLALFKMSLWPSDLGRWEMLIPVLHTCTVSGITQQAGLPAIKALCLAACKLGCSQFALPAAGREGNGSESLWRRQGLHHRDSCSHPRQRDVLCLCSRWPGLDLLCGVQSLPNTPFGGASGLWALGSSKVLEGCWKRATTIKLFNFSKALFVCLFCWFAGLCLFANISVILRLHSFLLFIQEDKHPEGLMPKTEGRGGQRGCSCPRKEGCMVPGHHGHQGGLCVGPLPGEGDQALLCVAPVWGHQEKHRGCQRTDRGCHGDTGAAWPEALPQVGEELRSRRSCYLLGGNEGVKLSHAVGVPVGFCLVFASRQHACPPPAWPPGPLMAPEAVGCFK